MKTTTRKHLNIAATCGCILLFGVMMVWFVENPSLPDWVLIPLVVGLVAVLWHLDTLYRRI